MAPDRHAQIEARAYLLWEREGRPEGKALEHWLRAENEIDGEEHSKAAGSVQPKPPPAGAKRSARKKTKASH